MHISDRLQKLDHLQSDLVASWDGMLILAGDVNIDMIKQETSDVKRYIEMPSNHWTWSKSSPNRGGSRIFFRRGCTRLLLYFNTNKPHFFFCRIPVVLENRGSSRGGGRTPCTLPLDPPLPKQQELLSPVQRLLITLLPIFLDALHILMFSHVHSLAITTRHMFFFNQY